MSDFDLAAARLDRGLSLPAAAAAIGVARGTLKKAESGTRPQPAKAKLIADFYGVQVTDLWPLDDGAPVPA